NACELTIDAMATFTVTDGNFINIQNDITVNGTLTVDHQGSVVQVEEDAVTTNNGSITVSKTTPSIIARNYVAMSSPMSAETRDGVYANSRAVFNIIPSNFVPFTIDFDTFPEFEFAENFLDDDNDFLSQSLGSDPLPTPGIGQLVFPSPSHDSPMAAYDLDYTQGTLNSGTISIPINYNGPATINNYNLLGNPYASAIDVEAFINANDAVNQVYYWEHLTDPSAALPGFGTSNFSMNDISIRNALLGIPAVNGGTAPGQFMASGQGFGIKADQAQAMANTPVVFTNSIRVTGNNDDFRTQTTTVDKLWLNLTTSAFEGAVSQTAIGFTPNATPGFDPGYDSPRLGTFLSLFTNLDGQYLAIQGREVFDTSIELTLGYSTTVETEETHTISIDHLEGIGIENAPVFLIDHLLGTTTNLKEQAYSFIAVRGIQSERFTVVFEERDALGISDGGSFRESVTLYPNPATNQVTLSYQGAQQLQQVIITNVNGKHIKTISLANFNNSQSIQTSELAKGMYFMQIQSNSETIVQKLIIK
ncbi:MAG: T9SS type A sorting domain-containing protein, partial [Dokdonia sp.]